MKKIIITLCIIAVVVGIAGGSYYLYRKDYTSRNYAKGMSEAADSLGSAVGAYTSPSSDLVSDLASGDPAKQRAAYRAEAEKHGIKLKDLSEKELEKLKEKNEKLQEDIYYIQIKMKDAEFGSSKYNRLQDKYYKLLEKQNEYQLQINYNEF